MSKGKNIFYHITYAVMFVLVYLLIRTVISGVVTYYFAYCSEMFADVDVKHLSAYTTVPNLLFGNLGVILVMLAIAIKRKDIKFISNLDMPMSVYIKSISYGLLLNLAITVIVAVSVSENTQVSNDATQVVMTTDLFPVWMTVIASGIMTPIAEELVYRYGVQYTLRRVMSPFPAILITSIVFGIMHVNPVQGLYAAFLGFVFGCANEFHNSILPSMIMHIIINLSSVILTRLELNALLVLLLGGSLLYIAGLIIGTFEKKNRLRNDTL